MYKPSESQRDPGVLNESAATSLAYTYYEALPTIRVLACVQVRRNRCTCPVQDISSPRQYQALVRGRHYSMILTAFPSKSIQLEGAHIMPGQDDLDLHTVEGELEIMPKDMNHTMSTGSR